uniref:Uncharacterized protein n=1 Tax=Strigamia maritima TaxID=126957 RepID=T1JHE6_STRMM
MLGNVKREVCADRLDSDAKLEIPAEHEALREETPPDLKGAQYPHLPRVGQIIGTPSDENEVLTLLPAIGEPHPYPYYVSAAVNLRTHILDSILVIEDTPETPISKTNGNTNIGNKVSSHGQKESKGSEDLAVEKLHQQFLESHAANSASSSSNSNDNNNEAKPEEEDENARGILDGPIEDEDLEWLWPELDVHVRNVVWTMIEERVRLLPEVKQDEASKRTAQFNEQQQTALYRRGFKKHSFHYDSCLNSVSLHSLINELHFLTIQDKLMRNIGLKQLQDGVISQQIADVILDASLKQVDLEVAKLDDEERKAMPERI